MRKNIGAVYTEVNIDTFNLKAADGTDYSKSCVAPTLDQVISFFDSKGIHIESLVDCTMEAKYCYQIQQVSDFSVTGWIHHDQSDLFYTRREALNHAFEQALTLLI